MHESRKTPGPMPRFACLLNHDLREMTIQTRCLLAQILSERQFIIIDVTFGDGTGHCF
jgi:hypothetical protein